MYECVCLLDFLLQPISSEQALTARANKIGSSNDVSIPPSRLVIPTDTEQLNKISVPIKQPPGHWNISKLDLRFDVLVFTGSIFSV